MPTINKGKHVQGVRTDIGVKCEWRGLIHGDHLCARMQNTCYKCGEMEHYARSCKRRANPNQGHKTKGESLHSRGEKVKEFDDLIQGMDFIKET